MTNLHGLELETYRDLVKHEVVIIVRDPAWEIKAEDRLGEMLMSMPRHAQDEFLADVVKNLVREVEITRDIEATKFGAPTT